MLTKMSTQSEAEPQNISRLVEYLDIENEKSFDEYCLKEIEIVSNIVDSNCRYISIDTVLFQAYVLLEFRIEQTKHSLSDRLIESIFSYIERYVKPYESSYRENVNGCLQRALNLFAVWFLYDV